MSAKDLSVSEGSDADTVVRETTNLVDHGSWQLCNGGKGLERQFKFKTFKATWVGVVVQCPRTFNIGTDSGQGLHEPCSGRV